MNFGQALEALKQGKRVARKGWNGKGMWLILVPERKWYVSDGIIYNQYSNGAKNESAFIGMKTADNKFVPWLASQTDILVEDWEIV